MKNAKHIKKMFAIICASIVVGTLNGPSLVKAASLEEYVGRTVDGSVLTDETESTGEFENLARSAYLYHGIVRITNNGGGYVGISGATQCYTTCNTVKLNVYLERSNGDGNFYSYKKWENVASNTNSLYFDKEVKVEKGYYYRLRGYHSCTKNGTTENGGSRTDGIYIG